MKAYPDKFVFADAEGLPLLISVTDAARLLGWGRTKLYHAIQRGCFTAGVVRVGSSISISRPALFRWLETVGSSESTNSASQ